MVAVLLLLAASTASACPFCTVESRTLTEEIDSAAAAVLAKLVAEAAPVPADTDNEAAASDPAASNPDSGKATFKVVEVLRGDDRVKAGDEIKVVYFGEDEKDRTFFVSGVAVENNALEWLTPLPLGETAIKYIRQLPTVPKVGGERLRFFQEYLENADPLLAQDAYDEFARAPYAQVHELKGHMFHDKIVEWIQSPDVNPSRRRLYLTMLGVCGSEADLPMLEQMIVSDYSAKKPILDALVTSGKTLGGPLGLDMWTEMVDMEERQKKLGLDATVACYLTLRGPDGLDLIDERFLKNPKVEYTHAYMTIMALRFHGEEGNVIPKERLLASIRLLLDNPDFADQVVPDLSRWEDWSVLDRLTEMYKEGDAKSYIRQPVVTYLTVASEQEGEVGQRAKAALAELEQLDPEGVKKARSLMAFGFLARARGADPATGAQRPQATPAAAASDGKSSGNVATTGFEASAADQTDDSAASSDIPAPDGFSDAAELVESEEEGAADEDQSVAAAEEDQVAAAGEDQAAVAAEPDHPAVAAAVQPAAAPVIYNRALVIGVPLAASVLLMAIYWLILRWGAV
ncbi:MAG: hypothetical protein AB7G28_14440 [Pirellulales bacterium]